MKRLQTNDADLDLELRNPVFDQIPAHIGANARFRFPVVQRDRVGGTVYLCGAGPSLRQSLARLKGATGDIWACNSAAPWLVGQGVRVTHSCAVEMSPVMLQTWKDPPPTKYLLASCVHPHLLMFLRERGYAITLFHNFVGFPTETDLYAQYPSTIVAGMGLNVLTRLIQVADYAGYAKIVVMGADCALGRDGSWHMDGSTGGGKTIMTAKVNGAIWATHYDLAYSAGTLVHQKRVLGSKLRLVGNTLPVAILRDRRYRRNPRRFLATLPHFPGDVEHWAEAERIGRIS